MKTIERRLVLPAIAALLLAACSKPAPPPPHVETPKQLQTRTEAVATQRTFMTGIFGEGQALVDTCKGGSPDSARLTFHDARWERAFTLDIVNEGKGAVATWQGLREDRDNNRVVTVGVQRVGLDVNGWRQVRQSVAQPRFTTLPPEALVPYGTRARFDGDTWRVETCLGGKYWLTTRHKPDPERALDFIRAAQGMMRLSGGVY
jgi:hypothetical protein